MGDKAGQVYKPRVGKANKNIDNFTPEMLEAVKTTNERFHHTFGYVKTNDKDNRTPFLDYKGTASAESIEKLNYYERLNEMNMKKRMKIKHGHLAKEKIICSDRDVASISAITELGIIAMLHKIFWLDLKTKK